MMMARPTPSVGRDVSEFVSWKHKGDDGGGNPSKGSSSAGGDIREAVQKGRPSVRDLANKFEKEAQAAASKAKAVPVDQLSGEEQFLQLKQILAEFRGRFVGRNKDDAEKALSTAESLEAIYIQRGAELTQRQWAVKNLVLLLKGVANDAKVMLEDVRSVVLSEIAAAQEIATKLQNVLQEQDHMSGAAHQKKLQKELHELKKESHEAKRIQMLHESSKYMDMEREINRLSQQLEEKTAESAALRKEVEIVREREQELRRERGKTIWYVLAGDPYLGSTLSIIPLNDSVIDLVHCTIQWYRVKDDTAKEFLAGAVWPQYAPEPSDVGRSLRAEVIMPGGKTQTLHTSGPIEEARGLSKYVENLASKGGASFNVRIVLKNGEIVQKQRIYFFDVNKTRIKLHKTHGVKAKEIYTTSMQLCGARVGGESAAQGLFWAAKKDESFMLVMESERERNAAIMLARKFAKLQKIDLRGPGAKPQ